MFGIAEMVGLAALILVGGGCDINYLITKILYAIKIISLHIN